jgi:hypothetical protein
LRTIAGIVGLAGIILFVWAVVPVPKTRLEIALAVGLFALAGLAAIAVGMSMAGRADLVFFYAGRVALILLAYIGASVVASTFIWLAGMIGTVPNHSFREILAILAGAILGAIIALAVIAPVVFLYALLPTALFILIAEIARLRNWLFYAVAGGLIGPVAAVWFMHGLAGSSHGGPGLGFLVTMIGGGIAGGLTYWSGAGRHAGHWRAEPRLKASEGG